MRRLDHQNQYISRNLNSARVTRQAMFNAEDLEAAMCTGCDMPPPYPGVVVAPEDRNHDRPYLLSNASFRRLRIIIFLGGLCLNAPWSWNRKTHMIDRWSPFWIRVWQLYWYFTTVQSTFMIIYHSYCLMGLYSKNLESYRGIFAYSLIIYWYACHLGYKTCIFVHEDRVRHFAPYLISGSLLFKLTS